ncbi:MAG: hypothetical protein DRP97_08505 [Candidatus Latescibacterota bacterium]|nr:MAG: hypothetical protein DRP97_08505 [Candidatus Latescibacterota bacterium]
MTPANVTVNPNKTSLLAQYTVAFNVGAGGALTAGSTIAIAFPSGTTLGSAVSGTPGNTTVEGTAASSVSVSGQEVTVTVPSGVSVSNNGSVSVVFANAANMIANPSTAGTSYQTTVKTSVEPSAVNSNTYSIFETSTVTQATVTPNPTSSGNLSQYTIAFDVGDNGALALGSDSIVITFPSGTTLGSAVQNTPGNTTINGTPATSVSVSGLQVTITTPVAIENNGSVSVVFANAPDMITNPTTAGSNKTVAVSTSQEPTSISSDTYTITSSGTFVTTANVSVDPDTVSRTASYTIQFYVGANGALLAGDQITVAFPEATTVPGSIGTGSIQVNTVVCTAAPQISGDTVTLYTPRSIDVNGEVSVVFLPDAGIVNPSVAAEGYTLDVSTNIEPSAITSNSYSIYNEDGSLPVELAYFAACGERGGIALRWRTESETNNLRWVLERSTEPEGPYEVIACPRGQGSTPQPTDYLFQDRDVKPDQVYFYRLADQDFDGTLTYHEIVSASAVFPKAYRLRQNYPNPFNPATTIEYDLPRAGSVLLEIYNMAGQKVRTLVDKRQEAAFYSVLWDSRDEAGREVGSGVYIYHLVVRDSDGGGGFRAVKRMVMVR